MLIQKFTVCLMLAMTMGLTARTDCQKMTCGAITVVALWIMTHTYMYCISPAGGILPNGISMTTVHYTNPTGLESWHVLLKLSMLVNTP